MSTISYFRIHENHSADVDILLKKELAGVPPGCEPGSDHSLQGADGGLRSSFQPGSDARGGLPTAARDLTWQRLRFTLLLPSLIETFSY